MDSTVVFKLCFTSHHHFSLSISFLFSRYDDCISKMLFWQPYSWNMFYNPLNCDYPQGPSLLWPCRVVAVQPHHPPPGRPLSRMLSTPPSSPLCPAGSNRPLEQPLTDTAAAVGPSVPCLIYKDHTGEALGEEGGLPGNGFEPRQLGRRSLGRGRKMGWDYSGLSIHHSAFVRASEFFPWEILSASSPSSPQPTPPHPASTCSQNDSSKAQSWSCHSVARGPALAPLCPWSES